MSLKQKVRDLGLRIHLKNQTFISGMTPGETKGVAILFSAESLTYQQLSLGFAEQIKASTREPIYLFGYINKVLDSQVTFGFPHFSLSDFGLIPDFSKHKIDLFMQRDYRVLINLDLFNHLILHYITNKINAINKIAVSPQFPALYNIIVERDMTEDPQDLLDKTMDIFVKTVGV